MSSKSFGKDKPVMLIRIPGLDSMWHVYKGDGNGFTKTRCGHLLDTNKVQIADHPGYREIVCRKCREK